MSALAVATDSVNLGQGFPDTDGPATVLEAACRAINSGHNQYPPGRGIPGLRAAIARHQQRFYGIEVDPDTEVLVTAGATEAIAAAVLGLCEPGDEVVLFEPYYDSYAATVALAGARHRSVTLRAPTFAFDPEQLAAAVGPRTRLLLLNSPHNPTGKVFTAEELGAIAELCVAHDLIAVTDEVYEHLTFDGVEHLPLCRFPGMANRTVSISSAAKTFHCTGWKVGWVTGSPALIAAVTAAKQFLTYVSSGPFQYAVAEGLDLGDDFYRGERTTLQAARDLLVPGLEDAGFEVFPTRGSYFVTTDAARLGARDGLAFCRQLAERCGVVAIPNRVFYDSDAGRTQVRFSFAKQPAVLEEAVRRLVTLRS